MKKIFVTTLLLICASMAHIIDDTHTFEVPQGAILQIERGDIKKSAVVFPISSELNYLCPCETE
jgi:hypothetical protein